MRRHEDAHDPETYNPIHRNWSVRADLLGRPQIHLVSPVPRRWHIDRWDIELLAALAVVLILWTMVLFLIIRGLVAAA